MTVASEAAQRMRDTYQVTGDKWFKIAAEELERSDWLRWGVEEIIRCTEPKAGNGDRFICGIATEAMTSAGFGLADAGIQKPSKPVSR